MVRDQKVEINGRTYMMTVGAKQDILAALEPFLADSMPWNYVLPAGGTVAMAPEVIEDEVPAETPAPAEDVGPVDTSAEAIDPVGEPTTAIDGEDEPTLSDLV